MKVKIRTLKQDKYEIDVEPTITIEKLKEIIEETHKFEKSTQTLIYAGKILSNEKTIEECNLKQDDFLVLMIKKAPSKPAAPEKPTETSVVPPPQTTTEKAPPSQSSSTTTTEADEKKASEALLTGAELDAAVVRIMDMGFTREQVIAALKVSYNNPERAVDYLMNGFPPEVSMDTHNSEPRPNPSGSATLATPTSPSVRSPSQSGSVFDGLRQHPQFAQLCVLAQQGGEQALKQILEYFAETNRPLLDLIMKNQDEFIRLLNTPVQGAGPLGPQGGPSQGVIRVHVTPEDEAIINNLVGMGFERNRVLEAYFLFEKDETLTANYLLNNPDGDGSGNPGSQ